MRQLSALWFYCKLCLANGWFLTWYTITLHLTSRGFLISLSLCLYTLLLVTFHSIAWNSTAFSRPAVVPQSTLENLNKQEKGVYSKVFSPTSLVNRKQYLQELLSKQPTHRDVLINLALIAYTQKSPEQALELLNKARDVDPNHPFLIQF